MPDLIWSICPHAESDTVKRVTAYAHHCLANGVSEGPATDAARDGLPLGVSDGVATVRLMGPMMRRAGQIAEKYFGIAGTDSTRLAMQAANADPDVDQILLRIDSPGGSVDGLDQLGETVATSSKPVTAVVDGMAASAAYYVASQADRIIAGRNDMVGSIGVRMMLYDFSAAFEKDGIEAVPIDTGKFKSAGAMGTKITDEQRADFQRVVDYYFADFVKAVSNGRGMSAEAVRAVADGRMFTQPEALANGLIDGVGTYQSVLGELRSQRAQRTGTARARLRL